MASYDIYGNRRGGIWEPDEARQLRERREYEARELRELNERLRRADRTLREARRLADQVDDGALGKVYDPNNDNGAGFRADSDTHGIASVDWHVHGRWEKHGHQGSSDHSGVKVNPGGAIAGQMSEPQRRAKVLLEQGLRQGTILGEAPPQTSQYTRKPGSIQDEGDVAADEGDDGSGQDETAVDTTSGLKLDPERNVHRPLVAQHMHGQYALHFHDGTADVYGNADHSRAALKAGPLLGRNF